MNEMLLCSALLESLGDELSRIHFETPDGDVVQMAPKIRHVFYPFKKPDPADDFPFLFVTPQTGATNDYTSATAEVVIYVGVYSEDMSGAEYLFRALGVIRDKLLSAPGLVLSVGGFTFRMRHPFRWQFDEDQPFPLWQLKIMTSWEMPATLQADPDQYL